LPVGARQLLAGREYGLAIFCLRDLLSRL
jgi:hypothetical protein